MDDETARPYAQLVEKSLSTPKGQEWLRNAHAMLANAVRSGKFNSERSLEVYTITIERAVMATTGYVAMKTLRESGITHAMASELVDQFRSVTNAQDQRPARRGILAKIIGK